MASKKNTNDENEKLMRIIHLLAGRLPWIAVAAILLATIATILQVLFSRP